jgi:deoxyribonuclease-1-like protein
MSLSKKTVLFILFFVQFLIWAQPKVVSWNIQNFGKSKTEETIFFIAQTLRSYDVVAIQEVVAGPGGAQAVAKLADELNRTGAKWDYSISSPTSSSPYKSERYAFLWKTSRVKLLGKPWLDSLFENEIEREPYMAQFKYQDLTFTLVNFHAVPKKDQPEKEIKFFKNYKSHYKNQNLIFLGDFNCPTSHSVFLPLKKQGFLPVFEGMKTSLKQKCVHQDCLASEYDNILLSSSFKTLQCGIIHFYREFDDFSNARKVSDHLPIWVSFEMTPR